MAATSFPAVLESSSAIQFGIKEILEDFSRIFCPGYNDSDGLSAKLGTTRLTFSFPDLLS